MRGPRQRAHANEATQQRLLALTSAAHTGRCNFSKKRGAPIHAYTRCHSRDKAEKELVIADNVQKHGAERKRVAAKSCGEDERRNTVTSNCNGARFYQLWGPLGVDRDFRLAWRVKNRRAVCLRARKMQRI
jgi:hypothetical protein